MPDEEYDRRCYVYAHIYNNMIRHAQPYARHIASFLYSDSASARNTFEKNVMLGGGAGNAMTHHCGKDNLKVNNVVHKTGSLADMWGGCEKDANSPQTQDNYHNIFLMDDMDNFQFYRKHDR